MWCIILFLSPPPNSTSERLGCAHVLRGRASEQRKKRVVILLLSRVAGLREVGQRDVSGRKYGRVERQQRASVTATVLEVEAEGLPRIKKGGSSSSKQNHLRNWNQL